MPPMPPIPPQHLILHKGTAGCLAVQRPWLPMQWRQWCAATRSRRRRRCRAQALPGDGSGTRSPWTTWMPWTRRAQWAHWAHWVHCVLSDTGITKDTGKTPTGHRRVNGHVVRHRAKTPVTSVISIDRDSYSWKTSFALQEAFRTKNLGLHNTIPPL